MKNKFIRLMVLGILFIPAILYAQKDIYTGDIPNIPKSLHISEVKTNQENIIPGGVVNGTIKIVSNEDTVVSGYKLSFELRQISSKDNITADRIDQARIIGIYHNTKELVIQSNQENIENFEYTIPKFLPEGDYYLNILLRNPESDSISWEAVSLGFISGLRDAQKDFIYLNNNSLQKKIDQSEWSLNIGIAVDKSEALIIKGDATLEGEKDNLTAYPKVIVYERAAGEKIVYESKDLKPISLKKGQSQKFEIEIPKLDIPGGYFATLVFEKDYQPISNIVDFHWVIKGESGRIINLTLNKTNFEKGEEAIIDMQLTDRADLQFSTGDIKSLGEVKVITTLNCDKNYKRISENTLDLNNERNLSVKIPIDKRVENCAVNAELLKNDKQLHSKSLAYEKDANNSVVVKSGNENILIYIGIGLILIIMFGLIFSNRKKLFTKLFLILGVILLSGFSYNSVLAGPCSDLTLTINNPSEGESFDYGSTIELDGSTKINYCTNYPSDVKLAFHLDGADEPFYIRDYSVPSRYGSMYSAETNSLKFGVPSISTDTLAAGNHKITMKWFQDCTRQGSGTATGTIERTFSVKSPEPSFRISQEKAEINIGDKFQYKAFYDADGVATTQTEVDVTNATTWTVKSGTSVSTTANKGEVEGIMDGKSQIEATYLGKNDTSDIRVRAVNEPYLIITATKDKFIYPETTKLSAKLVEFPGGVKTDVNDINFNIIKWKAVDNTLLNLDQVINGEAYFQGKQNAKGFTQVTLEVRKNAFSPVVKGVSNTIAVMSPTFRITPSIFTTNSEEFNAKDISFTAWYDSDGTGGAAGTEVTNTTTWSITDKSFPPIESKGSGIFTIPARYNNFGQIYINALYNSFNSTAILNLDSIGSPLSGNITILSIKDREITAYASAEGGKPLYTYSDWKVLDISNNAIPLESSSVTSNGVIYKFKIATTVEVPKKIKVQNTVKDTGGALDSPVKEFIYLGIGSIIEVNL